jgi:Putative DNA-binding domain
VASDMKFPEFERLVKLGELRHIDRKIECHAFDSKSPDSARAKAELAKDICAMANNGSRASYLLIGVSDKGNHFKPVTNPNLNDDNLQDFCKDAISPPPKIKVHVVLRENSAGSMESFLAMQIGPNPRHAYHLNRDFIDLKNSDERRRHCFRRNEVWIRRGATSGLATPEEIVRLMRGDKAAEVEDTSAEVVDFSRLETTQQLPSMVIEAERFFTELGCAIEKRQPYDSKNGFQVALSFNGRRAVFRCLARHSLTAQVPMIETVKRVWEYEHGIFILLMGKISIQAFPYGTLLKLKEAWGFFSKIKIGGWHFRHLYRRDAVDHRLTGDDFFPLNFPEANVCTVILVGCKSNVRRREGLAEACEFVLSDSKARTTLEESSNHLNEGLQKCVKEGWILSASGRMVIGKGQLVKGEFKDKRRPTKVLVRRREGYLADAASSVLRLSRVSPVSK